MKSIITLLFMFCTVVLTGQDSLIISDIANCINRDYTYDSIESEKIKTRFQKYVLKKTIDSLKSISTSSQVDYFNKLYRENGNAHAQYMHSDSQYYSIPYDPICDLYNRYLIADMKRKRIKGLLNLRIDNSEKITAIDDYRGQKTKIRIWEFFPLIEDGDNYVEIEIDKQQLHYSHYKIRYENSRISGHSIETKSGSIIIDEDFVEELQLLSDMQSFMDIRNSYDCVVYGYYNVIEIVDKGEYNVLLYQNIQGNKNNNWQVEKVRHIIKNTNTICGLKLLN